MKLALDPMPTSLEAMETDEEEAESLPSSPRISWARSVCSPRIRLGWAVGLSSLLLINVVAWSLYAILPLSESRIAVRHGLLILNLEVGGLILLCLVVGPRLEDLFHVKSRAGRWLVRGCIGLLLLPATVAMAGNYVLQRSEPLTIVYWAFIVLGFFSHLSLFLLLFIAAEFLATCAKCACAKRSHAPPPHLQLNQDGAMRRRKEVLGLLGSRRVHTVMALLFAFAFTLAGVTVSSSSPRVFHQSLRIRNLPPELDGYKIALVTDIHAGPTVGRNKVRRIVDMVNKEKPDLVALVGDLVDGFVDGLSGSIQDLRNLRAVDGSIFVPGNHDYFGSPIGEWVSVVEATGVRVLRNQAAILRRRKLCIGGVEDLVAEQARIPELAPNASAALSACPSTALRILLVHQPNAIPRIRKEEPMVGDSVDLFLAGHTHGGQNILVYPILWGSQAYLVGSYELSNGASVFVSAGLYNGGPPIKLPRLVQIPILILRPKSASS